MQSARIHKAGQFWIRVFKDLKTRGIHDILIAVIDGLKDLPEYLAAVFLATTLQTCLVHLIRNNLGYASWKDRKTLAAAIRPMYTAASAQVELEVFTQESWEQKIPGDRCGMA